jgi:PAS domain S-box-containing protein
MPVDATHLTSLFENATEGIILTNSKGQIILVNPAAETMFGYKADELIDRPIEVLIPDRYKGPHKNLRDGFYQHPQNRVMGQGRDLHAKRKDGSDMPVEVSLSFYKRKNELFVIAFIVNITERKKIENNVLMQQKELEKMTNDMRKLNAHLEAKVEERTIILKEALQKLEQSQEELSEALNKEKLLNEIKSRFVSMASHEFRTPLSTVLSSASLLARYTAAEEQDKRNRHIGKIKSSVKHLNDILEDFLSLGKLDEGKVTASCAEFDLKELITETTEEMKGLLKKSQEIHFDFIGNTNVYSDKKLVKNILINLISNATKFSNEGMMIEVKCDAGSEEAIVSVADHGIGIPKEDQDHLFSSFFRGANAANIQGTGLGLHIVKRYVDLLGGSVHLQSELNKGTTVIFEIPILNNNEINSGYR